MVRIRLRRTGLKGQPSYRLVVADKESPRDGRFLEIVGYYNPRTEPATLEIKEDRIFEWMSKGALPSDSVAQLFKTAGTDVRFERFKKGEPLEKLLEEAEKAKAARFVSSKTSKVPDSSSKKADKPAKSEKQEKPVKAEKPEITEATEETAKPEETAKAESTGKTESSEESEKL